MLKISNSCELLLDRAAKSIPSMIRQWFLMCTFGLSLGLISTHLQAQEKASDEPPQMSEIVSKTEENSRLFVWDRSAAFGKVPVQLQPIGDFICAKGRIDLHATGYHPKARDRDGKDIPGGGYLCEKKPSGYAWLEQAPRLQLVNGMKGWDRPAAFGQVPGGLTAHGQTVCDAMSPGMRPIGFHPEALDVSGKKIIGGGFLCGPASKP